MDYINESVTIRQMIPHVSLVSLSLMATQSAFCIFRFDENSRNVRHAKCTWTNWKTQNKNKKHLLKIIYKKQKHFVYSVSVKLNLPFWEEVLLR